MNIVLEVRSKNSVKKFLKILSVMLFITITSLFMINMAYPDNALFSKFIGKGSFLDLKFAGNEDETTIEYVYPLCSSREDIRNVMMETIYNNRNSIDIRLADRDNILSTEELFNLIDGVDSISYTVSESRQGVITEHIEFTYTDYYAYEYAFNNNDLSRMTEKQSITYAKMLEIMAEYINDSMDEYEKALVLHDYIVKNCRYNIEDLQNNNLEEDDYTAYGTLIIGESVCSGYAETYRTLLMMCGIESRTVSGKTDGEAHAWNLVKINENWYHVDVTWDDPVPDTGDYVYHNYFNVTDEVISADHIWNRGRYPQAISIGDNYFVKNDLIASTTEKIEDIIDRAVAENKQEVSVLWKGEDEADLNRVFYHYYSYTLSEHSYGDEYRVYNIRFGDE